MGCQLWQFWRKLAALKRHRTVFCSIANSKAIQYGMLLHKGVTNLWQIENIDKALNPHHRWTYRWLSVSMMTSLNGNIFRVTGHLRGEFTGPRWIPHTKASDAELDIFFDLRPNKRLSKQSWGWWFETPSRPSWRHRNDIAITPVC